MQSQLWQKISEEINILCVGLFPGITIIGLVMISHLTGLIQPLEWSICEQFLQIGSAQALDPKIIIMGIKAADLPQPQNHPPRVILLHIDRDLPVNPRQNQLTYHGQGKFRTVSWRDIQTQKIPPNWIRDRLIIIAIADRNKDLMSREIPGGEVSQIISQVIDTRQIFHTWRAEWVYVWIFSWGFLGIITARLTKSILVSLLIVGTALCSLSYLSYWLLIWGWWIPVIPALLVLTLNGIGISALYEYDQTLKSAIRGSQSVIDSTFETIHNGPLQSLAKILNLCQKTDLPISKLLPQLEKELEKLNLELRGIYELLQQEPINQEQNLYLGNGLVINLQNPLHEILYQVYTHTLERDFPYFRSIKVKIRSFDQIDERNLHLQHKRGLCRFLEEALCNVGKHAQGTSCLQVTCCSEADYHILSIIDNGLGLKSSVEGRGTQQFKNLARQIKGKFRRVTLSPQGTLCELSWPVPHILHKFLASQFPEERY